MRAKINLVLFLVLLLVISISIAGYRQGLREIEPKYVTGRINTLKFSDREMECVAQNAHYEARAEGSEGMYAVTAVVLNRYRANKWPSDLCDIVYQKSQFSWTNKIRKKPWKRTDKELLVYSGAALADFSSPYPTSDASMSLRGNKFDSVDPTNGATHYHNFSVSPKWAKGMEVTAVIGNHIFYKERQ